MAHKVASILDMPSEEKPSSSPECVDAHFHLFQAHAALPGARYTPTYDATFKAWQAQAAPLGVTRGVLVQTSFMGIDNALMLAQLKLHPATLRGVAVVASDATPGLLLSLHAQGVRGIRLNLAGQSHDMAEWRGASALWDALLQLGWHVELHTDAGGLPSVVAALPMALPLVLDHFAKPARVSMRDDSVVAITQRTRRGGAAVHVKMSAPYRLETGIDAAALAQLWQGELGNGGLLWGSDWPHTNHESEQRFAALHDGLAEWLRGDAGAILAAMCANPVRLYGFGAVERP